MHNSKNTIHRDIKPLNIMLKNKDDFDSVIIIDFGFATEYKHKSLIDYKQCGTVLYQPPE